MPPSFHRRPHPFALPVLLLVSLGIGAAWILLSAWFNRPFSMMAVVAAIDAALVLRVVRMPPGPARALLGMLATAVSIAAACWGMAAARIGGPLGLQPWESMLKMGAEFGWLLVRLGTTPADLAWFAAALAVAAFASR